MSLRRKLVLFFIAIVVLPIALLAYLLVDISADSRQDRADAELTAGMLSVDALYDVAGQIAPQEATRVAKQLEEPMRNNDAKGLAETVNQEFTSRVIAALIVRDEQGNVLKKVGPELTLSSARAPIMGPDGRLGSVQLMVIDSRNFLSRIEAQIDHPAALVDGEEVVASTVPVTFSADKIVTSTPNNLTSFDVEASTGEDRGAALALANEPGDMKLVLLSATDGGLLAHPLIVAGLLSILLIIGLGIAALILNRMRRRINEMLVMTRRIGQGDFSGELSEEGNDEMAGLAREINRMRSQISMQMDELLAQRRELDESVHRLGDAFASGLDREALLEVLIETAIAACRARQGQVLLEAEGDEPTVISAGDDSGGLEALLSEASEAAIRNGTVATVAGQGDAHAMAEVMPDPNQPALELCVVAVARDGEPFTETEQEALRYLISQCAISIENITLHEQVAKQAVTDDLTGLANHRALTAWIEREIQRVQRFGEPLSLLMIDVDEFKRINDTFGHPQGDRVLREVARVIDRESRLVDEAARYGGDEFVLALPGTDSTGAGEVAERIRRGIAEIEVTPDGHGIGRDSEGWNVSASIGVADTEMGISDATDLIAAADYALYRAKSQGKDRVSTSAGA